MKPNYNIADLILSFLCGCVLVIFFSRAITIKEKYESQELTIVTQRQTIERLSKLISKMDTLHYECFKVSEIQKLKK